MKCFIWTDEVSYTAFAHCENVTEARQLLRDEIGGYDGSCPEREKARHYVDEFTPSIYIGRVAGFRLSDSAEVRELEKYQEKIIAERDQLRAELARLQRNEDCVQRLIVWAAENGWNGVDNSKILDSFIIGLFDQLRAELAAAKDLLAILHGDGGHHADAVGVARACKDAMDKYHQRVLQMDALAAHVERLEKALGEVGKQLDSCKTFVTGGCMGQTTDNIMKATVYHRVPYMLREFVYNALAATPAQSLETHDAAVKVAVLREVAEKLRLEESTNSSMHAEFVEAEADRIEKEAQRG